MDGYDLDYIDRSIMSSGDSPTHHNRTAEAFDFPPTNQSDNKPLPIEAKPLPTDGRSSPVATTSRDIGVQSGQEKTANKSGQEKTDDKSGRSEIQAAVLVEPGGDHKDKDDEGKAFGSPTLNNIEGGGDRDKETERRGKGNDGGYEGKEKKDRKDEKFRKNGNIDKLDGVWLPKDQKKPHEEQEDDNCIVKCLYVTMTCCECSIM